MNQNEKNFNYNDNSSLFSCGKKKKLPKEEFEVVKATENQITLNDNQIKMRV